MDNKVDKLSCSILGKIKELGRMASASRENDHCKQLEINIEEEIEFASTDQCCIYKVPQNLRKINRKAYTPKLISIGPFHCDRTRLAKMEEHKLRYQNEFFKRFMVELNMQKKFLRIIEGKKERIRCSYAESTVMIDDSNFIEMILYDAVFIIEFFLRNHEIEKYYREDILLTRSWLYYDIKQDLMLLENQLPYFVIEDLYNEAFPIRDTEYPPFLHLSCNFFEEDHQEIPDEVQIKHFTDLLRLVLSKNRPKSWGKAVGHLPNAAKLHEAGVKFTKVEGTSLLDIKFVKKKLGIPCMLADANMECYIRNLMALEQCHYPNKAYICSYIKLMDFLVDTEKDVELLVENGIIRNRVGHSGAVADIFNRLCLEITEVSSCYHKIADDLNAHYKSSWNRTMATLTSVYFNNLWRSTATVAATILLVLTFIQTVCSIIQVIKM